MQGGFAAATGTKQRQRTIFDLSRGILSVQYLMECSQVPQDVFNMIGTV